MLKVILTMMWFLSNDCNGCGGDSNRCNGDVTVIVTVTVTVVTNDVFDLRTLLLTCKSL